MRRGRIFFYLAFIVILGLVAVVVVYQKFLQAPPAPGEAVQTTPVDLVNVVVVTQRVPRGEVLTDKVLGVVTLQRDLFIQGMFSDVNQVVDKRAKFDLDSGIPLTSGMLVDTADQLSATGSNAALQIPRGMVAVSIPIKRLSSVSYAPQAGDHVNVIVTLLLADLDSDFQTVLPNKTGAIIAPGPTTPETGPNQLTASITGGDTTVGRAEVDPVLGQTLYQIPAEAQRPRMVAQTLLQDAVVLHMGEFSAGTAPTAAQATPEVVPTQEPTGQGQLQVQEPTKPEVVTLIVTPQDAVTLNYLLYSGAGLSLALRSSGDDTRVQTEAVTLQFLLDQYNIPVPVKLPYGMQPRVDELTLPDEVITPTPTP